MDNRPTLEGKDNKQYLGYNLTEMSMLSKIIRLRFAVMYESDYGYGKEDY